MFEEFHLGVFQKFKTTENRLQEQTDLIGSLKEEVEKVRKSALDDKEVG